jgi:hypothetical protein
VFVGADAEYRRAVEAGAALGLVWHLPIANGETLAGQDAERRPLVVCAKTTVRSARKLTSRFTKTEPSGPTGDGAAPLLLWLDEAQMQKPLDRGRLGDKRELAPSTTPTTIAPAQIPAKAMPLDPPPPEPTSEEPICDPRRRVRNQSVTRNQTETLLAGP